MPEKARMCFLGLKVIAKDYLSVLCPKLKSYHLKCIFLFSLEGRDPALWNNEQLEESFDYLLSKVMDCVETRNCPNFWFSEINMFKDFRGMDLLKLLKKLTKIRKFPAKYIENFYGDDEIKV